ncbi:MAG: hypothetical protein LBC84_09285 [Prevotellaceae bacterium]|jgi:hypothetical protein|nr:hypothetical protein [Prevotellaceae bacterium]
MELKDFLIKFLPDYTERLETFRQPRIKANTWDTPSYNEFCVDHFHEALQNYTDKICQMQRMNCAENYIDEYEVQFEKVVYDAIMTAEQPKIKEL